MKFLISSLILSLLLLSQETFANRICPQYVYCENGACTSTPNYGIFYTHEIWGRVPGDGHLVRVYYRPQYYPHVICSYSSTDRKTQIDLATTANLMPDLNSRGWRISDDNITYLCGKDFQQIPPASCPFVDA